MCGIRSKTLQLGKGPLKTPQQVIEHASHAPEFVILIFNRKTFMQVPSRDAFCPICHFVNRTERLSGNSVSGKSCGYQGDGQTEQQDKSELKHPAFERAETISEADQQRMAFNRVNVAYQKYTRSIRKLCCALIEGICSFAGKLRSIEWEILQSRAAIEYLAGQILDLHQPIDKQAILRVDKVVLLKLQVA
jgi:hypothetical protein